MQQNLVYYRLYPTILHQTFQIVYREIGNANHPYFACCLCIFQGTPNFPILCKIPLFSTKFLPRLRRMNNHLIQIVPFSSRFHRLISLLLHRFSTLLPLCWQQTEILSVLHKCEHLRPHHVHFRMPVQYQSTDSPTASAAFSSSMNHVPSPSFGMVIPFARVLCSCKIIFHSSIHFTAYRSQTAPLENCCTLVNFNGITGRSIASHQISLPYRLFHQCLLQLKC